MGPLAMLGVLAALLVIVYMITGGGSGVEVDPKGEAERLPTAVKVAGGDPAMDDPDDALPVPGGALPKVAPSDRPDPNLVTQHSLPDAADVATLEELLEGSPNDIDLVNIVAHRYYQAHRLDDALTLYAHGLKLQPEHVSMLFYQASCCYLKGWVPRAREGWEKVAKLDAGGKLGGKAKKRLQQIEEVARKK